MIAPSYNDNDKETTPEERLECSLQIINYSPQQQEPFKQSVFNKINTFRTNPKEFYSLLKRLSSYIDEGSSYGKIKYKNWKYKIEYGNYEYLMSYVHTLQPMNKLEMNDDIVIPVSKANQNNFIEIQSQYQAIVSFYTKINDPDFVIVIRCLSNIIKGVFDCGKYDIFNRELTYIGVDANNKEGKEFFATFAFQ
jgi:hypothetical protein